MTARHALIRELIAGRAARLGARRAPRPRGGTAYELGDSPRAAPVLPELVRSVDDNGTLVVILTAPGVATALDRARPIEILGTIAAPRLASASYWRATGSDSTVVKP